MKDDSATSCVFKDESISAAVLENEGSGFRIYLREETSSLLILGLGYTYIRLGKYGLGIIISKLHLEGLNRW